MKVYALVGKSGTGKSFQAVSLCRDLNADGIIDDGLFIFKGTVVAGISAKREGTKVGAIKTALFTDEEHRSQVAEKIKEEAPESMLILGTSDGMVERIAERLELPHISRTIYIDDITTEGERNIARRQRKELGKHVIPVPTFQLKRQFSGYFIDPLRIFRGWGTGKDSFGEKSVVRPTYSYMGEYIISDKVIHDIVGYVGDTVAGLKSVIRVTTETATEGIKVLVLVNIEYGYNVVIVAKALQEKCVEKIEAMTAFNVNDMDIEVRILS